ncbi:hypothetical protein HYY73_06400 [Candidatus Woesearchaeota archaeon]|nr:hypothetical protein [Candidatus Woesearchaeota archaeon]
MEKVGISGNNTLGSALNLAGSDACTVESLRQRFDAALKGIREEFDDHRESINDSTNEIEANYELVSRLESKVDRLQEQLEHLQLSLANVLGSPAQASAQSCIDLDEKEKEVFLVLYTGSDEKPLTYREIAAALKESEFLIRGYITNMIEKGVPVTKRYLNDVAFISLDRSFKDRQAKENIVKLSQRTVREFAV